MLKIKLLPGALPLGGLQLDSVLEVSDTVWHRTTDYRTDLTTAELESAYEGHRIAYKQAVDRAFDAAMAELRGSTESPGPAKAQATEDRSDLVPVEQTNLPPLPPSLAAAGIGAMEGGTR